MAESTTNQAVEPSKEDKLRPGEKKILDRLKKGPLPCADPEGLAKTPASLKVQICRMRAVGFNIETTDPDRKGGKGGRRPGEYVLKPVANVG